MFLGLKHCRSGSGLLAIDPFGRSGKKKEAK